MNAPLTTLAGSPVTVLTNSAKDITLKTEYQDWDSKSHIVRSFDLDTAKELVKQLQAQIDAVEKFQAGPTFKEAWDALSIGDHVPGGSGDPVDWVKVSASEYLLVGAAARYKIDMWVNHFNTPIQNLTNFDLTPRSFA